MSTDRAVFKAILWKEIRENLKWAVLGLLFVSVGAFLSFQKLLNQTPWGGSLNWGSVSYSLFWATPFLTPVVGLMIGVAQVILENRGDNWGFLTHRPIQRSTLFRGKAAAGILLYIAAVGVPLTLTILWVATPGHLPMPFDIRMVLPVIADVLCGLVYYFAGLLTGMRDARWYASRVMGIGLGIVCSLASTIVPEFWQAVTCCAIGILVSGASAFGAFVEGGRFESQPRLTRFATGISIGAGLLMVGTAVFGVGGSFLPAIVSSSNVTRYRITGDGAIVQAEYEGDVIVDVRDLQGRPIEGYRDRDSRGPLNRGVVAAQTISPQGRFAWNEGYRTTSELFQTIQSGDLLSNGGTISYYYMPRLGRIAAYENRSAKLVGWLGPHGFVAGAKMPDEHFERPLTGTTPSYPTVLSFEDAVYRLDLYRRHIEKIFTADTGESVIGASDSNSEGLYSSEFGDKTRFVVISTTKRVVIQGRDASTQLSAPRDSNSNRFGSVMVYRSLLAREPQTFIWYSNGFYLPEYVVQYGSSGESVGQYPLPSLFHYDKLTWGYVLLRSVMENVAMRTLVWKRSIFDMFTIRPSPNQLLVSWLIPLLEGVLFAALAFARGRRYAFSSGRLSLWTAIGFALGPLGFAIMLALLEWPTLENCPACGRTRLVTRDSCEHCSRPFTLPETDGTEVFEAITSS